MSRKGLKSSTVTEIAQLAEINDSVIYHYFKNKEDLLFAAEGLHLQRVNASLKQQLTGIPDPFSRLSKMVWFHLHYNLANRDYAILLLFECRSNLNFYKHRTYQRIREYSQVMFSILQQGVASGAFRRDLNIRLVRDLILGALDWLTIKRIVEEDYADVMPQVEKLMRMVGIVLRAPQQSERQRQDKRARLLEAAESIFAQKGFAAATISDIARQANVSEATIYEYFKNKKDLLTSIPEDRLAGHIQQMQELFVIKTVQRKLRRFIRHHFLLYMTQPNFLRVFLLNVQLNPDFYKSQAYEIFQRYIAIVNEILEEGIANQCFWEDTDLEIFHSLLFGGFNHVTLRWYVSRPETDQRKMEEINEIVELLLDAVLNRGRCSLENQEPLDTPGDRRTA